MLTRRLPLSYRGGDHCTAVVGYVSAFADLQTPVQFDMSYSLVQEEPTMAYEAGAEMPDINAYPILNQAQAKKRFQVKTISL